jgi:hypothetical protein
MRSPPSRTNKLVREGGLRNISHDFNRRRSIGSNLGYSKRAEFSKADLIAAGSAVIIELN